MHTNSIDVIDGLQNGETGTLTRIILADSKDTAQ